MGSSVGESGGGDKGTLVLLQHLQSLHQEGKKNGDLKFSLKDGHIKAHSLIIKARCKGFRGELNYPHVTQETFSQFLLYIYTAKLKVEQPLALFSLYLLSLDFGMEELSTSSLENILSTLNHNSALQILQESVTWLATPPPASPSNSPTGVNVKSAIKKFSAQNKEGAEVEEKVQGIVDTCITHLSEHSPSSLKRNPNFLALPTHTIKIILSSPHFCVEEEEVWRCVLRWAQHKGGVSTHVSKWSETERLEVSAFLTPVISHVKLLLIDSRVFAQEVEPTGCVPMALSLERYRAAALCSLDSQEEAPKINDPRLTKRSSQKLFHHSLIINSERVGLGRVLQEWYQDGRVETNSWKLLYRASSHGFSGQDFHSRVDGQGPTYVIVLLKNSNWICGGYTDVPWGSEKTPKFVTSSKSFLFAMNPTTQSTPVQFGVVKKHFAVCHDSNSGPIFGAGADLSISSNCGSNEDSYTNLPHSYEQIQLQDTPTPSIALAPSYNFVVADYEVFAPNFN